MEQDAGQALIIYLDSWWLFVFYVFVAVIFVPCVYLSYELLQSMFYKLANKWFIKIMYDLTEKYPKCFDNVEENRLVKNYEDISEEKDPLNLTRKTCGTYYLERFPFVSGSHWSYDEDFFNITVNWKKLFAWKLGFLKTKSHHEAWKKAGECASDEEIVIYRVKANIKLHARVRLPGDNTEKDIKEIQDALEHAAVQLAGPYQFTYHEVRAEDIDIKQVELE